jgi:hypothetical protein
MIGLSVAAQQRSASGPSVQGVWRVVEVTDAGPNGRTMTKPNPAMYIFAAKHYAQVIETGDSPRPDVGDLTKATADQVRAVWGPFAATAGTYEVSGGMLTLRPMVAKDPQLMKPGAFSARSLKFEGNTLTMVLVRNENGPVVNPLTVKMTRLE